MAAASVCYAVNNLTQILHGVSIYVCYRIRFSSISIISFAFYLQNPVMRFLSHICAFTGIRHFQWRIQGEAEGRPPPIAPCNFWCGAFCV